MKCHYNQAYSLKAIHKINPDVLFIAYSENYFCLFTHRVASQPYAMLFIAFGEKLNIRISDYLQFVIRMFGCSIVLKFRRSRLSPRIGISKFEHPISNTQFPISIGIEFNLDIGHSVMQSVIFLFFLHVFHKINC
jgi:hypothetical protein